MNNGGQEEPRTELEVVGGTELDGRHPAGRGLKAELDDMEAEFERERALRKLDEEQQRVFRTSTSAEDLSQRLARIDEERWRLRHFEGPAS